MAAKIVVTFVHGTIFRLWIWPVFGRSTWTDKSSPLPAAMTQYFEGLELQTFSWTGRNAHQARLEAAGRLKSFLENVIARNPEARHYVIAHSHGGNVALYALHDIDVRLRDKIKGLVCIGTPFIQCHRRDLHRQWTRLAVCSLVGTALWAILGVLSLLPFVFRGLSAGMAIIGLVGFYRLSRTSEQQLEIVATQTESRLSAYAPGNVPMLCVRSGRDEAKLWLDLVSAACRILSQLWDATYSWAARLFSAWRVLLFWVEDWWVESRKEKSAAAIVIGTIITLPFYALFAIFLSPVPLLLLTIWLGGLTILAAASILSVHLIAVLILLARTGPWGFGEHWLLNWILEVGTASLPDHSRETESALPNGTGVITLNLQSSSYWEPLNLEVCDIETSHFSLNHVKLCSNGLVVSEVIRWIKRQDAARVG